MKKQLYTADQLEQIGRNLDLHIASLRERIKAISPESFDEACQLRDAAQFLVASLRGAGNLAAFIESARTRNELTMCPFSASDVGMDQLLTEEGV